MDKVNVEMRHVEEMLVSEHVCTNGIKTGVLADLSVFRARKWWDTTPTSIETG
jgi:hypothetical protein